LINTERRRGRTARGGGALFIFGLIEINI